jgi:hypothetical protein
MPPPTTPAPAVSPTAQPTATTSGAASQSRAPGGTLAPLTPTPRPAAPIRQLAAEAEAGLRSGEFEATIDYGNGNRSLVTVRFDLGDSQRPRRIHLVSTPQGTAGSQAFELIVVGNLTWQRQGTGPWVQTSNLDGLDEQLQAYLPNVATASGITAETSGNTTVLRWHDPGRAANMALQVATATGVPLTLEQTPTNGGSHVRVVYRGWNVPVAIEPPAAP